MLPNGSLSDKLADVNFILLSVVVQFAVAAVSDRRNLLNQKTAVRDRRYKESNCNTTLLSLVRA